MFLLRMCIAALYSPMCIAAGFLSPKQLKRDRIGISTGMYVCINFGGVVIINIAVAVIVA